MARTLRTAFEIDDAVASGVAAFREEHALGRPPSLEVEVYYDDYLDPEDLVGGAGTLVFGYEGGPDRTFTGVVDEVTVIGTTGTGLSDHAFRYLVRVVTPLTLMGRTRGCAIFQDKTVRQIAEALLGELAPSLKLDWRLAATYPPRAYCVQYEESALALLSRLFEHEGIYYFVETDDDGNAQLVIADESTAAPTIDGDPSLPRRARSQLHDAADAVYSVAEGKRTVSGKFVLRDFAFEKPEVDLTSTAAGDAYADLEVYDYPGGYFVLDEGKRLAKVRLEAELAGRVFASIEADCTRISVGRTLTIADLGADSGNDSDAGSGGGSGSPGGDWFVTGVVHEYVTRGPGDADYVARADLVPASVRFRPARRTPRPTLDGPQTATVVAPQGAQVEEIHTDAHGRCKVKFHWDLAPDTDDKASAWMRVAQPQTSGSMMLPRIGWEVVVEFLEGDPDRPIVTGRLYNGLFMPPYALPEGKTRTSLQTASSPGGGGTNEVRFEDKAGAEELMIHSQYDTNIVVAHDKTKNVGQNDSLEVKVDSSTEVVANQTVKVTKGYKTSVGGNQTVQVGASRKLEVDAVAGLTVGGSSTTFVGAAQTEHIGNPLEAIIALAAAKATELAAAKAADAVQHVTAAVQGKIDQALGPVNDLVGAAMALGAHAEALKNGDMSSAGALIAGAASIPAADALASAMGGGGSPAAGGAASGGGAGGGVAATEAAPGTDASAASIALDAAVGAAVGSKMQQLTSEAAAALDQALGIDADGGGGSSEANEGGPAGDVDGVDGIDRAKGPGHSTYKVAGSHSEKVAAMKVMAAVNGIHTNVGGSVSQNVGAAHVDLVLGDFAEAVQGNKAETELGLIVLTKAGESEHVGGAKMAMVGGAIIDKVKGNLSIEAQAALTMIGAMHKLEASEGITLKCGASFLTIKDDGVTIESPMVMMTSGAAKLAKPVSEGG